MRTSQCLLHVVNTRLWLNSQETEAFGRLSFALEAYPNLKVLGLIGWNMRAGDVILPDPERSLSRITQAGMFAKLTHLHLVCIAVARGSHCSLLSHLNVPSLKKLELARSDHIGPFLRGLISTYATTEGSLTSVLMTLPWDMAEPHTALQIIGDFLKACPKLRELGIDVSRHGVLRKDSILPHAETLHTLILGNGRSAQAKHMPGEEMQVIFHTCKEPVYLAINLPPTDLGSLRDLGSDIRFQRLRPGDIRALTEYEVMMVSTPTITPATAYMLIYVL
jgi:hypothetical protein